MINALILGNDLKKMANKEKAGIYQRFFKTGEGEYAHGDKFMGVTVPQIRMLVKKGRGLSLTETKKLVVSEFHEERLLGLLLLVDSYKRGDENCRRNIFNAYIKLRKNINNWDLVDATVEHVIGAELFCMKDYSLLDAWSESKSLWERRMAIIATFHLIKKKNPEQTFKIATTLMQDSEDLIHKATGWMLREVGKRCGQEILESYLRKNYKIMPRTMLRYAIERFPEDLRRKYLKGKV